MSLSSSHLPCSLFLSLSSIFSSVSPCVFYIFFILFFFHPFLSLSSFKSFFHPFLPCLHSLLGCFRLSSSSSLFSSLFSVLQFFSIPSFTVYFILSFSLSLDVSNSLPPFLFFSSLFTVVLPPLIYPSLERLLHSLLVCFKLSSLLSIFVFSFSRSSFTSLFLYPVIPFLPLLCSILSTSSISFFLMYFCLTRKKSKKKKKSSTH